MADRKTIIVFGFTAEVLSESRFAYFSDSTHSRTFSMADHPETLTKKSVDSLKAQALAKGYDQVVIRLDRYISYTLRTVMQNRSGAYNKQTTYTHKNGVWTKKVKIDNQTY
jgi:hypothetical protein